MGQMAALGIGELRTGRRMAAAAVAALLATTALSATAHGQDGDAATVGADSQSLDEEIIVTARRRQESLQSVPVAITAVSGEVLEDFRIDDIGSLERIDPSLSVSPSAGRPNSPVFSLRGIRPAESIYGQDPTVAVYLADVVQSPAQGSNLGFYDLENVQILKGPQGTLFGRNTVGGAILLTPRKPGDTFGGNAMIGVGSYGLVEGEIGLDIPLADTFRVRIAGRAVQGGDYQTNVAPGPLFGTKLGGQGTRSARLTLRGELSPDITNTVIATYDRNSNNGRGTVLEAVNPAHPIAGTIPALADALVRAQNRPVTDIESRLRQRDKVEAWGVTNTLEAQLSDAVKFKFIGAYREVKTDVSFDIQAGVVTSDQQVSLNHTSLEAQLLGSSFDGRLDWVAGLYYYSEKGEELSPGDFYGSRITQFGAVDNQSYSVFAQGSFRLTPKLTLTAGGRLNWDRKRMSLSQNFNGVVCLLQVDNGAGGLTGLPISACRVDLAGAFSQPTGTVSLDYKVTPDILVYAASRIGYRSGGFNLRATQPIQYQPFQPESVIDFEGGTKADWTIGGVRMRTNLAVFYQKYSDIQRTVSIPSPAGSPASAVVNAASANVFGIELQQTIRPADGLAIRLNYAYNEPRYNRWIDPATGADLSQTPFFFTPKHSGSAMVTYEKELRDNLGSLKFGLNAAYMGGTWINAADTIVTIRQHPAAVLPLLRQEAYWLLDLNVGWENIANSKVDLSVYVKNLTDTQYRVGGVQLYTGASGLISAVYGEPRTVGAQLRVKF